MDKKMSNFSVGSKGYCFLCLNKISSRFSSTVISDDTFGISASSVYSLQDVARHLKVDMRKAFIEGGPIPPNLLAKVEKSKLTVELCDGCGSMTKNVSKLCRQLEKLNLEIESGLESILGKMSDADQTGRTDQFREVVGFEFGLGMGGGMEIMEALRLETMFQKDQGSLAPISNTKLSSIEIRRRTSRIPKQETEVNSEALSDSGLQQIKITKDESDNLNWALELEDDCTRSENSFVDALPPVNDSNSETLEGDGETGLIRVAKSGVIRTNELSSGTRLKRKWKWTINPGTGKYKCTLCPMEYSSSSSLPKHYDSVYRKIRFKCKICGKLFTRRGDHKRHHESVHLGIRFQCQVCEKSFAEKWRLMKHQRTAGCASAIKVEPNVN